MSVPYAFCDLPPEAFPLRIDFLDGAGDLVHTLDVPSPGLARVPALVADHGPVTVRVTYGDGVVAVAAPGD